MREHVRLRHFADRRDGTLAPRRAEAMDTHLATGCAQCASSMHRLDTALAALREGPLPEPPRAVVRDTLRMFRAARWAELTETAGRIVARLVFDRRFEPVPALRSAPGATRRMLWNVGKHELDACIVERASDGELVGQFLPVDDDGSTPVRGEVEIRSRGRRVARAAFDLDGRFAFASLPHGTYALLGRVGREEFVVAPLTIGDAA